MKAIKHRLSADLKTAMKEKNLMAIKTIRLLMSAIDNAGAVPIETPGTMLMAGGIAGASEGIGSTEVPRKILSGEDIRRIILGEMDEISATIEALRDFSHPEIEALEAQIILLKKYLDE